MESTLSHEEFERLQNQLLQLKSSNYALEEQNRKYLNENHLIRAKSEDLEKQLSRSKLNPLSLARNFANKVDNKLRDREVEHLIAENENLLRKIESQEQEFRVTNETLKAEITSLMTINEKLENEIKLLQSNYEEQTQPECDLGVNIGVISDTLHDIQCDASETAMPNRRTLEEQNSQQLSFAILAEKERLETEVKEYQELVENLNKENQLITTQLEEMQLKCAKTDEIQSELDDCNSLVERQNCLIEEMRALKNDVQTSHKSDLEKLANECNEKVKGLESQLETLLTINEKLTCDIKEMSANLLELKDVNKINEKLVNELESYKEELSFCKSQCEETIDRLEGEHRNNLEKVTKKYEVEILAIKQECDDQRSRISQLDAETRKLNQQIIDNIEERKIHEKKGVAMVKELKRQLHSERKRAEKLQEKFQEVLSESSTTISSDNQRKQNTSYNGNDSSSVSSWSFMSAKDNSGAGHPRTSSLYSGSDGRDPTPPYSPTNDNMSVTNTSAVLEEENTELVSRVTSLQQEKWMLEEKINHLELSNASMAEDILRKTEIIQHYCMEGRADRPHCSQALHNDKLTVKRVVDFIKDKGDENMREINRKVQRMLEETLTKNMHLQNNLETLSNEVVRLNRLIENKDSIPSIQA